MLEMLLIQEPIIQTTQKEINRKQRSHRAALTEDQHEVESLPSACEDPAFFVWSGGGTLWQGPTLYNLLGGMLISVK